MENQLGLIHIYCGDGKGKTTAALGLCIRAAGNGLAVRFVQFLKGGMTGELNILRKLENVQVLRIKKEPKFTFLMDEEELAEAKLQNMGLLEEAFGSVASFGCQVLILDEVLDALEEGLIEEERFRHLIEVRQRGVELVMTGRLPRPWLLELADYVTDMEKIKHPFDKGIEARVGIEL